MALKRRKILTQMFNLGHGTTTVPTDSGGTLTGDLVGIHSFMGNAYLNARDFDGSDIAGQMNAAMVALPSTGGIVDTRGFDANQSWGSDPFDSITKNVTVMMGSITHTMNADVTIPSNATVIIEKGGTIATNGHTLTQNGSLLDLNNGLSVDQSETATLGAEMNTAPAGWTTGSNVTDDGGGHYGFTAVAGTISKSGFSVTSGTTYVITWGIGPNPSDTCGTLTSVSLGSVASPSYLWSCTDTGVFPRSATLVANTTGSVSVTFTPAADFAGHIFDISVKPVTVTVPVVTSSFEFRSNRDVFMNAAGTSALAQNVSSVAGDFGTTGTYNLAYGYGALAKNTAGYKNVAVGPLSQNIATDGFYNTSLGYGTLQSTTNGFRNTAIGVLALSSNTIGWLNTAVGDEALYANTSGRNNTAFGPSASQDGTTARFNSAYGVAALNLNVTGNFNSAFGGEALQNLKSGDENVAIGVGAAKGNELNGDVPATNAFNYATVVGTNAGIYLKDAGDCYNTFIGHWAGADFFDQSTANKKTAADTQMTFVGASSTKNSGSTLSNGTALGYRALVTASDQFVLGNSSVTEWSLGAQFSLTQDTGRLTSNGLRFKTLAGTNNPTYLTVVPRGSEDETGLRLYNVADPTTNYGAATFNVNGATVQIGASSGGGGTIPTKLKLDSLALQLTVYTYSALPTCNGGATGMIVGISDSNVGAFGDAITGSGANQGLAYCGGAAWTFR